MHRVDFADKGRGDRVMETSYLDLRIMFGRLIVFLVFRVVVVGFSFRDPSGKEDDQIFDFMTL